MAIPKLFSRFLAISKKCWKIVVVVGRFLVIFKLQNNFKSFWQLKKNIFNFVTFILHISWQFLGF